MSGGNDLECVICRKCRHGLEYRIQAVVSGEADLCVRSMLKGSHPESAGHLFDLVNRQARVISWYAVFMIRWRLSALPGSTVLTRNSILRFRAGLSRTSLIPSIR